MAGKVCFPARTLFSSGRCVDHRLRGFKVRRSKFVDVPALFGYTRIKGQEQFTKEVSMVKPRQLGHLVLRGARLGGIREVVLRGTRSAHDKQAARTDDFHERAG